MALSLVGLIALFACASVTQIDARKIVEGAKIQAREAAVYDPSYARIEYPGGDVSRSRGVCTDVVIRALRHAGYDLQKLIRDDMRTRFSSYPRRGRRPDTNIDHRRVPNQVHFLKRYGLSLTTKSSERTRASWKPGDIAVWKLDNGLDHIGIITDRKGPSGWPTVVHNLRVCVEEDCLRSWRIVGHYRYPK